MRALPGRSGIEGRGAAGPSQSSALRLRGILGFMCTPQDIINDTLDDNDEYEDHLSIQVDSVGKPSYDQRKEPYIEDLEEEFRDNSFRSTKEASQQTGTSMATSDLFKALLTQE